MLKHLVVGVMLLFPIVSHAEEWVSPIDKKYLAKDAELFAKFDKARDILNLWRGGSERLEQADDLLTEIIEADSEYAPAHREYGRLFIMAGFAGQTNSDLGGLSPPEAAILNSIEIEPDYADAYVLLGHLYTLVNRYYEAEVALRKAEEIGTEIPWVHLNWGDLLNKQGKYAEARDRFKLVVDKGTPNQKAYGNALYKLSSQHLYLNELDEANIAYAKLTEFNPESASGWSNYSAFLLFSYEDVDGAIEAGKKAHHLSDSGNSRFVYASALFTKWAMLKDNPMTALTAQDYFYQAWAVYPHPEYVIEESSRHSYTEKTAEALTVWMTSQAGNNENSANNSF